MESLVDKTRIYWPYMGLFVVGACLASLILICCSCHQIRKAMHNKRKTKGNFDGKLSKKITYWIEIIYSGITYQNHNSHHPHTNSYGKQSLGKKTIHPKSVRETKTIPIICSSVKHFVYLIPYRSYEHFTEILKQSTNCSKQLPYIDRYSYS